MVYNTGYWCDIAYGILKAWNDIGNRERTRVAQVRDGSQPSFADVAAEGRRRKLGEKRGRHLAMIGELVPWEDFRPVLEAVWRRASASPRLAASRGTPC